MSVYLISLARGLDPLPYWEWGLDTTNIYASPVFDGSDTSVGGDGAYVPHGPLYINGPAAPGQNATIVELPAGRGGGCVARGPFHDMTVHLGPIALPLPGYPNGNTSSVVGDPLQDNPRCLQRDLSTNSAARFASFANTTDIITKRTTIETFQAFLQADPRYIAGQLGPHGGGHYTIGGNPGGDVFSSPGDPAFYLHHAQVDRVFWIWQMQDFKNRQVRGPFFPSMIEPHRDGN